MQLVCDRCRELRGEKRKEASAGVSFSDSVSAASERKRRQRQRERDEAKRVELERQKERRERDRRKREVSTAALEAFQVNEGPWEMASVLLTGMMRSFPIWDHRPCARQVPPVCLPVQSEVLGAVSQYCPFNDFNQAGPCELLISQEEAEREMLEDADQPEWIQVLNGIKHMPTNNGGPIVSRIEKVGAPSCWVSTTSTISGFRFRHMRRCLNALANCREVSSTVSSYLLKGGEK